MLIGKDYLSQMRSAAAHARWSRTERVNHKTIHLHGRTFERLTGYRNDLESWNDCISRLMNELDGYRFGDKGKRS